MSTNPRSQPEDTQVLAMWDLLQAIQAASSLEAVGPALLASISRLTQAPRVVLYLGDPRFPAPFFHHYGFNSQSVTETERLCAQGFQQALDNPGFSYSETPLSAGGQPADTLRTFVLRNEHNVAGLLGLAGNQEPYPAQFMDPLCLVLAQWIENLAIRCRADTQLSQLNTYLTISSMMSQSQGLHESLEVALYCCMEAVQAETTSVLLLDDEQKNFKFYHVEGPSKLVLETTVFPADQGLAGSVLNTRQSEVINDVQHDPRFYTKVDQESGFQTRNMIAVPLVAGEEPVGVLEVINKYEGEGFSEEDHLLLLSIAEEIAFAIRNAKVFEYVVNSYCKQRQGINSCRGCERPLGSWTPCVRYREVEL